MATKQIRVSEDLYARVQSESWDDETLGETLERLVDDYTLVDFADDMAEIDPGFSVEEATDGAAGATPPSHGVFADLMQIDVRRQIAELWIRSHDECCLLLKRQGGRVRITE